MHLTWCEIDLKALTHNYAQLIMLASHHMTGAAKPFIMPVIKADAYGHGVLDVARVLDGQGCKFFGVSNADEGLLLRQNGFAQKILLFESTLPTDAKNIVTYDLTPTVCTQEMAAALNKEALLQNKEVGIHLKVDTGMGRLGIDEKDIVPFVEFVKKSAPALILEGIYTHFPLADTDKDFTFDQMRRFRDVVYALENRAVTFQYVHAGNSMGLGDYRSDLFNCARPGIMLYGLYPSVHLQKKINLKPVMSVKSRIIFIKSIDKGQGISYGHTFKAKEDMTIAVLPIGYSNGYLRSLSNKGFVLVAGVRCPVIGRVTMDQVMVDITPVGLSGKIPSVGAEAVIIGSQKDGSITADDVAGWAGTISYEMLCSLGSHLPRKIIRSAVPRSKPEKVDEPTLYEDFSNKMG